MAAVIVGDDASIERARQWLADAGCLVFAAADVATAKNMIAARQPLVIIAATTAIAESLTSSLPAGSSGCRLLLCGELDGWRTLVRPLRRRVLLEATGFS